MTKRAITGGASGIDANRDNFSTGIGGEDTTIVLSDIGNENTGIGLVSSSIAGGATVRLLDFYFPVNSVEDLTKREAVLTVGIVSKDI